MLTLNDYQTSARKTAIELTANHMAFGLLEESGEIAGIMKRVHRKDKEYSETTDWYEKEMTEFAYERLKAELGDVLWYTAMLADVLGYTLGEVAAENLAKLQRRKAKDMIHGSGDDR